MVPPINTVGGPGAAVAWCLCMVLGLNGAFDFNLTSLALPGMRVVVHETPDNRRTSAPHVVDGWYLRPAPDHYRCHRVYIPRTRVERIAKTVEFFPHYCPVPACISTSAATAAARALAEALLHPTPTPFAILSDEQFAAIQILSRIFSKVTENPPTAVTPKTPQLAPAGALQMDCPGTISEGASALPTCITTKGDHGTCNSNTRKSPTQNCAYHPSPMYTAADPNTNTCHH